MSWLRFSGFFLSALLLWTGWGAPVADCDFGRTGTPMKHDRRSENLGFFQGPLPSGCAENFTSWNRSSASTEPMTENGEAFLRFRVERVVADNEAPQFRIELPKLVSGRSYRLTATVRNRSDSEVTAMVRMVPAPYKTYHALQLPPSPQWQTRSSVFQYRETGDEPAAIFLILSGKGEVDLKSIALEELAGAVANPVRLETRFFEGTSQSSRDLTGKGLGKFSGPLPKPWFEDFCHFQKAEATTELDNLGAQRFLRFRILSGEPQFSAPVSGIESGRSYRLTALVRNLTEGPVKVSLRLLPEPYTTLAAGEFAPSREWTTQTLEFQVTQPVTKPVGLILNFFDPGIVEISDLKLEEFQAGASRIRRPDPGVANYFRNSRLPRGLQSGWQFDRDSCYGSITPAPGMTGPSGSAALKLESWPRWRLGLYSEPFNVADPTVENAVSFSYRGDGGYTAEVQFQGKALRWLKLEPSADWKRVELPFRAPADAWAFTLKIIGTGTIWVDAFRAAPATEKGYRSAGDCEVALTPPPGEASTARILFPEEAARIGYHASGEIPPGTELRCALADLYGGIRQLPPVALSNQNREGDIDLPIPSDRPFGQFRLEVQAFQGEKAVSPPNELVITRIPRPVHWGEDAPDSPFGIHVTSFDPSLKAVKAAGVNWARLHDAGMEYIGWFYLEPEKGVWKFRDRDIQAYRDNHIRIFGQLGTAPRWASYLSRTDTGRKEIAYHDRYFQPLDRKEFENYATTVATRYKGVIDDWFIWNEPWIHGWWGVDYDKKNNRYITSEHPQEDFAKLCAVAYDAVKRVNPAAKVSGFNTTAGANGTEWTRGVLEAGGLDKCDTVDFHFYTDRATGYPGDGGERAVESAVGLLLQNGLDKPLYMSEGQGASLGSQTGDTSMRYVGLYRHTIPWENSEDYHSISDRNVRYNLSLLANKVDRVFLYSAHCYTNLARVPYFLVMFNADGYPHPMLAAYSAMTQRLEGRRFDRIVRLAPGVHAYIFSDGKRSTAAISPRPSGEGVRIGCDLPKSRGADLYGNPLALPATCGGRVFYIEAEVPAEQLAGALRKIE